MTKRERGVSKDNIKQSDTAQYEEKPICSDDVGLKGATLYKKT